MKLKTLCFALLGLWSTIGVNTAHTAQASRFARLAAVGKTFSNSLKQKKEAFFTKIKAIDQNIKRQSDGELGVFSSTVIAGAWTSAVFYLLTDMDIRRTIWEFCKEKALPSKVLAKLKQGVDIDSILKEEKIDDRVQRIIVLPAAIEQLSNEEEKIFYRHSFVENEEVLALLNQPQTTDISKEDLEQLGIDENEFKEAEERVGNPALIDKMLELIDLEEKRGHWALLLSELCSHRLSEGTRRALIRHQHPRELQEVWIDIEAQQDQLVKPLLSERAPQGALFSHDFLKTFYRRKVFETACGPLLKKKLATQIVQAVTTFAAQEYKRENVVLLHGQADQWTFIEKLFTSLLHMKTGKTIPDAFVTFRFQEKAPLTGEEVRTLRKEGVTWRTYDQYRDKILFTNLHLLANEEGSNSLNYMLYNNDITTSIDRQLSTAIVESMFRELGMEKEYGEISAEPFENLYALYRKEVTARGNVGRLIALSLPQAVAKELCYPTESGGGMNPQEINGDKTVDMTVIAKNYGQLPFENEFALILSETITNPEKAAAAGIVMKTFTSEPTEESKKYAEEFEREFAKVLDRIEALYHERIAKEVRNEA